MSYTSRIGRSVVLITLFTALTTLAAFGLRAVLARSLSLEEYGLFYATLSFIVFIHLFKDWGVGSALMATIPGWLTKGKHARINQGIWSLFVLQGVYLLITLGVIIAAKHWLAIHYFKDPAAAGLLLVLAIMTIFESVVTAVRYALVGFQANGLSASLEAVRFVLILLFTVLFLAKGTGVLAPAFGYLLASFLISPLALFVLKRYAFGKFSFGPALRTDVTLDLVRYGTHFVISSVGILVFTNTDSLMLTYFSGLAAVGLYNAALPLVIATITIAGIAGNIILPLTAELRARRQEKLLIQGIDDVYRYFLVFTLPILGVAVLFPAEILTLLFGASYVGAANALRILMVGAFCYIIASINFSVLAGMGNARLQARALLLAAVANIIINFLLIPRYGIIGAAVGTALANGLALLVSIHYVKRTLRVHVPIGSWLLTVVLTGFTLFLIHLTRSALAVNVLLETAIVGIVAIAVYAGLCLATGVVNLRELRELLGRLSGPRK